MKKILIIQTAFIGDVILATSLVETLHAYSNETLEIDLVVRKGNESLLENNPGVNQVYIWDKKGGKYKNLFSLAGQLRKNNYWRVYNLQRFASTGFLTWRTKADLKAGYKKNPFSWAFGRKIAHEIGNGKHEVERNFDLISPDLDNSLEGPLRPKLYPGEQDKIAVDAIVGDTGPNYVLAPASVWFTKQLPEHKWVELMNNLAGKGKLFLIGAPSDKVLLDRLIEKSEVDDVENLAGKLSLVQSAELISRATWTFVNDSAPLHLSSAMNSPVTAFFCSTVPEFGFGPLSTNSEIRQVEAKLDCRPCGLHGYKACPKGHFKCGNQIDLGFAKSL